MKEGHMAPVIPGRFTALPDEPVVVFLIGIRINRLLAFRKWVPTFLAMGPMRRTLAQHPESGFLGAQSWFGWRQVMSVQYWRSFEDLERFARSQDEPHLRAWQRFNRAVGYTDGSVGIWHETYLIAPGQVEAIHDNMPLMGLLAATQAVPAAGHLATARDRLRRADATTLGGSATPARLSAPDSLT
jgi:Domain of unknown function (DUF4188)